MIQRFAIALLSTTLIVAARGPTQGAAPWKVGLRRVGPVRYGMTLSEASRALGETLSVEPTERGEGCDYIHPSAAPRGVSFMVLDPVIERVDVRSGDVATVSGAHIGSTEDEIKALYPDRIEVQPHPYDAPGGHYLLYIPRDASDSAFRIIFETDGKRVTTFRAGRRPAVEYIEGCA